MIATPSRPGSRSTSATPTLPSRTGSSASAAARPPGARRVRRAASRASRSRPAAVRRQRLDARRRRVRLPGRSANATTRTSRRDMTAMRRRAPRRAARSDLAADAAPAGRLHRSRLALDAPVDPHARAAADRAVPVRAGRLRPVRRPARDVPRLQGRLLQRLFVRDRPSRHDRHGPLLGTEIADGARRTVAALRKFQLTQAVGDPEKGVPPRHLEIPPVIVDMDAGYGNIFNVQRQTELLVTAGRRGRAPRGPGPPEALRPHRRQGAGAGDRDDRQAADDARRRRRPRQRGLRGHRPDGRAVGDGRARARRGAWSSRSSAACATSTAAIPDLLWCEFPTVRPRARRGLHEAIRKRFPDARFAFNYSSCSSGSTTPTR